MNVERRRRDEFWMGQITTKLDNMEKMLSRVEDGHASRLTILETRVYEIEAQRNRFLGQISIIASFMGILSGYFATLLQKHLG